LKEKRSNPKKNKISSKGYRTTIRQKDRERHFHNKKINKKIKKNTKLGITERFLDFSDHLKPNFAKASLVSLMKNMFCTS
jgi:hypothetical protein